jgi:hypothetical protein
MLTKTIRRQFLQFCNAELAPAEFEAWICAAADVEATIGRTAYLDLISADYGGRDAGAMRELCERLLQEHHPGELKRYRVTRTLESMLREDEALLDGLRKLVRLRHQGCEFIPIEFVGFESETDSIPSPQAYHLWEPAVLADLLARGVPYRAQIRASTEGLLNELRHQYPDDI